jgi:molybdate transport system ATP-binding protein
LSNIEFNRASIRFSDSFSLKHIDWTLQAGEIWAIVGPNGSGKSALAASLAGAGQITAGAVSGLDDRVGILSIELQAELIDREHRRDDSDITDQIFEGTPVRDLINEVSPDPIILEDLISTFQLHDLMERGFRKLSTGETRKVLLTRALARNPSMMVLDEPFEGLDVGSAALLEKLLRDIASKTRMVLVVNRLDEIPDFVTHVAYLKQGHLMLKVKTDDEVAMSKLRQLFHLKTTNIRIPESESDFARPSLDSGEPLVLIRKGHIRYTDKLVFENLDWRIEAGQHWQLTGPNGSGKTCLLKLITGDHPQCYVNDIGVFGYQRGTGESIWEIKQYIGLMSSELQWSHRISVSCRNVIISGFYDSVGLYQKATDLQTDIANQWLQLLGLESRASESFTQLSYGDQRLILIARAMVKHPQLLILDEPCFGLDDINRQTVLALIEKICSGSESTVIYVNHHAGDKIDGIKNHLSLS